LWKAHQTIACPEQIDRLGLRFVNRIRVPQCDFELSDYLSSSPQPPHETEYPIASFLHQETFKIIGHPYEVNLIKTIQEADGTWLILDIDVFTTSLPSIGSMDMSQLLKEMRWLKNKFFFNSLTKKAWEEMQ